MTPIAECVCGSTEHAPSGQPLLACPKHGFDLNTVEGLAGLLRYAGVEVGSVGGQAFREHAATRILPLVRQHSASVHAAAYRSGILDEQTSVALTGGVVAPNRVNPYEAKT